MTEVTVVLDRQSRHDAHTHLKIKTIRDYAGLPSAYRNIAKNYATPLIIGPPLCDELITLILHMYTEEEARLAQHVTSPLGISAREIAHKEHLNVERVVTVLDRLISEKGILLSLGRGSGKRYCLIPLVPGAFEMSLVHTRMSTVDGWHQRFAELFETLFETGFISAYTSRPLSAVRYLPVGRSIEASQMALPSDRLEEVFERYQVFGVGICQCRSARAMIGSSCSKELETCISYGSLAEMLIANGRLRKIEREEAIDIKRGAEENGLATFLLDVDLGVYKSGTSCSCCGDCCYALRTINEFNKPGIVAPPHFQPVFHAEKCSGCGMCAGVCPMGAISISSETRTPVYNSGRCIGCGLCAVRCGSTRAILMNALPGYQRPPRLFTTLILQNAPNYVINAVNTWRKYIHMAPNEVKTIE
jgi:H+/Na+-translocating ferredoxin:NAD+ oxidoreductase subunit B